jgi:hypothetical protein
MKKQPFIMKKQNDSEIIPTIKKSSIGTSLNSLLIAMNYFYPFFWHWQVYWYIRQMNDSQSN